MSKKLIIPKQIITLDPERRILKDHVVEIVNDKISAIAKISSINVKDFDGEILNASGLTLIPGFIQTHIHLCQTLFRGLVDDFQLLDWLQLKIFPFENAHDKNSLRISAQLGINELLLSGTTTILDMGTINHQEVIFEELINSGIRAFAGKCMIDQNDIFPAFKSSTGDELSRSYELAGSFHNKGDGRIKYAFAPRFALSSSENLLKGTKEIMKDFDGSLFHSHTSENKNEAEEVRKKFNKENIEYFDSLNVIDERSVLAHCVYVNENEIGILKNKNVRVAHCPTSNLKLGSGIADIPRFLKEGISVSLGADGAACNNSLNIFNEMRLASLIQKPFYGPAAMDAETVFCLAAIEGAKALHIDNEVGSIEAGKKADLVLLDLETPFHPLDDNDENIYSKIVYSSSRENIKYVMINGEWIVNDGKNLQFDQKQLYEKGKEELKNLLKRV